MTLPENLDDINLQLDNELKSKIPTLSNSSVAEWRIWTRIFSIVIRAMQVIVNRFQNWVDQRLTFLRPGTIGWYAEIAKQFQYGDSLQIKDDGSLGYPILNPSKQIIAAVAVTENEAAEVVLKVARIQGGELTGLDQSQILAFSNYIDAVKFVGTKTRVVSTTADLILYNIEAFYNPAFDENTVKINIESALDLYRSSLGFDGVVYVQKLIQAIMLVPGVVTVNLISLEVLPAGGQWQDVIIKHETQAGYFNYDADNSTLILTPFTSI